MMNSQDFILFIYLLNCRQTLKSVFNWQQVYKCISFCFQSFENCTKPYCAFNFILINCAALFIYFSFTFLWFIYLCMHARTHAQKAFFASTSHGLACGQCECVLPWRRGRRASAAACCVRSDSPRPAARWGAAGSRRDPEPQTRAAGCSRPRLGCAPGSPPLSEAADTRLDHITKPLLIFTHMRGPSTIQAHWDPFTFGSHLAPSRSDRSLEIRDARYYQSCWPSVIKYK